MGEDAEVYRQTDHGEAQVKFLKTFLAISIGLSAVLSSPVSGKEHSDWVEEGSETSVDMFTDPTFEDVPNPFSDPAYSAFSGSSSGTSVEKKDGKTTLKLGVEHQLKLAPLPDALQVGSIFSESLLENTDKESLKWYQIPTWLTGKWKRNRETTVFTYDYASKQTNRQSRSFMSEQVADFGVQLDRDGHVWNCNLATQGVSNRGSYRSVALVKLQEPVVANQQEVILREVFNIINVTKGTDVITESYSIESLTRYRPISEGHIETFMSIKAYNADGTPRQLQQNRSYDRKIGPMCIVDEFKGRNVREDFIGFLRSHNEHRLAPGEIRMKPTVSGGPLVPHASTNRAITYRKPTAARKTSSTTRKSASSAGESKKSASDSKPSATDTTQNPASPKPEELQAKPAGQL